MSSVEIPEDLVTFVQVLEEDQPLRLWFTGLEALPLNLRRQEISRLVSRMERGGEDPKLVSAAGMLARPEVFDAVTETLRQRA